MLHELIVLLLELFFMKISQPLSILKLSCLKFFLLLQSLCMLLELGSLHHISDYWIIICFFTCHIDLYGVPYPPIGLLLNPDPGIFKAGAAGEKLGLP